MRQLKKAMNIEGSEAVPSEDGLAGEGAPPKPFEVRTHSFGFKPGIDLDRMNQLVDELEAEEAARKLRR